MVAWLKRNRRGVLLVLLAITLLGALMGYKLSSLTYGRLSQTEMQTAETVVGWHGIYNDPLYLPIKVVRSVIFWLAPDHGAILTRLPNIIFGLMSISFSRGQAITEALGVAQNSCH